MNRGIRIWAAVLLTGASTSVVQAFAEPQTRLAGGTVEVSSAIKHDVSPPLRDLAPQAPVVARQEKPLRSLLPAGIGVGQVDRARQTTPPAQPVPGTIGQNFDGLGNTFPGFTVVAAPPDPNGAVGATQFVQWVNLSFAVFDKTTGAPVMGPTAGNTLWTGFGAPCETSNDGDPIAQYDKAAGRWVLTQPVFTAPFAQCVAASMSSDATGGYFRYAFPQPNFPDYPKLGVWPDAYYVTVNAFSGRRFAGARACALDRMRMLVGGPATQQCVQLSPSFASLLPSDLDGTTAPPAGSPAFFLNFGANSLNLWKFHVDFAAPANSTLSGPINLPVAPFSPACRGGACIPQLGTRQLLDSLADRLMYRLAYRQFADHASLVVNHSVDPGNGTSGIRWYELRSPNGVPSIFQQGTFAPDANFRWMGSIAMDKLGDIAVGYSVSSSQINPQIRLTGRLPTDPLGTLDGEIHVIDGTGSQLKRLNRWGDYSSISVDPIDDCTFWYTTEYLATSGTFNWSTRIAAFKFANCV